MRASIKTAMIVACGLLAGSGTAFGFGGQIAVGMNYANQVPDIEVPFTADATLETAEYTLQTRISYQDGKIRDEFDMEGQSMVTITRPDRNVTWMVMPQNFYMEIANDETATRNEQMQQFRLVEREVVGQEEINGMQTTRYRVVYETNDGRYGGFTWFNEDNIAVRAFMVSEVDGERSRINFEITNLEIGPVDDTLFELPAGAQKFDMGAMMGGLGGAAGALGAGTGVPGQNTEAGADDSSFSDELAGAAVEGAQDAAVEETRRGVKEAVSGGFRRLRDRLRNND